MTLVKICGITNVADALAAVEAGANLIGFVFAESPRQIDPFTAKHIVRTVSGAVRTVGVFTEESSIVLKVMDECNLDYVQLHGGQSEEFAERIGAERVIRAVRVKGERTIANLDLFQNAIYYLLDTYREGIAGGTGETFDWELAIRAKSAGKPIFLSGGLNPENVFDAVQRVRPFAVDASSGLESSPGVKDHNKIKEFINNVRKSDATT
ncbi:MAG: phosphoribosylanthranilate isomerase [Armatimonadetes bacterium]|nr:phosphoribosylanthranilate isomerase [Armatimonadota bacterium]